MASLKDGLNTMKQGMNALKDKMGNPKILGYVVLGLVIAALIVGYVIFNNKVSGNKSSGTQTMTASLKKYPNKITNFSSRDERYSHNLRDYYIMSSYNSCCNSDFYGTHVDKNALMEVIRRGVRVLDFEIYSVNGKTVIAASPNQSIYQKGTYNSIPFSETMANVNQWAFSQALCRNYNDPLFLHFRIKSKQPHVYKDMVDVLYQNFGDRKLGKEYNYQYGGENLGKVPLADLQGKVIIMCNTDNDMFINTPSTTPLNEFVNIASNSAFLRQLRDYDVKYGPNMDELKDFNKKNMSITMPDLNVSDKNMNAATHRNYGCQMACMNFQSNDSYLENYIKYFNEVGHAFVLKPKELRYIVTTLKTPPKQDPKLSFATQEVKKPYYTAKF